MDAVFNAQQRLPIAAFNKQDSILATPFEILRKAIAEHSFPSAAAAIVWRGKLIALKALGKFTYEPDSPEARADTIFDLASVTKVVATTTMAMILYERGLLDLEAPVAAVVSEFLGSDPRRKTVTVRMLLAHSSGLAAYERLYQRASNRDELLSLAFTVNLIADPGTQSEYSDIGFIILGSLLERIADESLDRFCQREIFGTLGMVHTMFNPPVAACSFIPPTVKDCNFRHRVIQGEVQDENASVLGGVAGHAGVFSSATDMAIFASALLEGGHLVRPGTLDVFTRRETSPAGTSRALGWDTPSSPSQSGRYFSPNSYGHLGYTGASVWVDPDRQLSIVLLTNRTWPDCRNQAIKTIRPAFHDAVIESLELEGTV